jgi:hypothetical protein
MCNISYTFDTGLISAVGDSTFYGSISSIKQLAEVISGFLCSVYEICILLGFYTV